MDAVIAGCDGGSKEESSGPSNVLTDALNGEGKELSFRVSSYWTVLFIESVNIAEFSGRFDLQSALQKMLSLL